VPVIWLIAGVVLAIAELFTLDFVLIMLGAGAFAAALTGVFNAPVPIQIGVFGAVSVFGLVLVRPAIKTRLHRGSERALMGVEALKGAEAIVVEEVADGRGQIKIGGELWSARPADIAQVIAPGAAVRVVEIRGATAVVWKE
jgi:membrane protein implicated in regulation of membrane protease activity